VISDIASLIVATIDGSPAICAEIGHTIATPKVFRDRAERETPFPFIVFNNSAARTQFASNRSYVDEQYWDIHVYGDETTEDKVFRAANAVFETFSFLPPQAMELSNFSSCLPTSYRVVMNEVDGPSGKIRIVNHYRTFKFLSVGKVPVYG
jgi:hypothetical protein